MELNDGDNSLIATCERESQFTILPPPQAVPSAEQKAGLCASSTCHTLLAELESFVDAQNLRACELGTGVTVEQVLNFFDEDCPAPTLAPTP